MKAAIFPPSDKPLKSKRNSFSKVIASMLIEIIRIFLDFHRIPIYIHRNAKQPHKIAKPVL
ncbi:hypothetical protein D3C72_2561150 [compost metagenome]